MKIKKDEPQFLLGVGFICFYFNAHFVGHVNPLLSYVFRNNLTHCGLPTPYVDKDLGQHWLR